MHFKESNSRINTGDTQRCLLVDFLELEVFLGDTKVSIPQEVGVSALPTLRYATSLFLALRVTFPLFWAPSLGNRASSY